MPRKLFRKYLPSAEQVRANPWIARFGGFLRHPGLWHLNRDSVSGGVAVGLFSGLVPGPLQMLTAAAIAIPLRVNLPVALICTLYTNPFTIVPLYMLAYGYGSLLVGGDGSGPVEPFVFVWSDVGGSLADLFEWMFSLGKPLFVGLLALAATLSATGWFASRLFWRWWVSRQWRARVRRRGGR